MASNNSLILSDPPIAVGSRPSESISGPVFGTVVRGKSLEDAKPVLLSPKNIFPFGSTPPEILAVIFFHCLPAVDELKFHVVPSALFRLALVCKTWRDVINGTPYLWSCINIACSDYYRCNLRYVALLFPTVLDRSGICPLQMSILGSEPHSHGCRHHPRDPSKLWQTISNQLARCDRLSLDIHDSSHPIISSLPQLNSTSQLKHLTLSIRSTTSKFPTHLVDYIKSNGSLRSLKWNTPDLLISDLLRDTNWPSLTSLEIHSSLSTNQDFVKVLLVAPNLVTYHLKTVTRDVGDLALASTPLIHQALRDLKLRSVTSFSAFISLPALESLVITASPMPSLQAEVIPEFPALRIRELDWPSLTSVCISAPQLTSYDCVGILKSAPLLESYNIKVITHDLAHYIVDPFVHHSLHFLKIETGTILSAFLRPVSCPNLESLHIEMSPSAVAVTQNLENHEFPDFIRRSRPLLQRLVLENLNVPERGLIDCLQFVPTLTHLELHEDLQRYRPPGLTHLIVSALSDRLHEHLHLCPHLTVMKLTGGLVSQDGLCSEMISIRRAIGGLKHAQVEFGERSHAQDEITFRELRRDGFKITWFPRSGM
ncbi:hypothetical protein BDZ97DRAFT_1917322 [Flammula alnicola]|nr:hypothetical protein BDZ97DRAFT_1917322 [Flammula alnicola]